MFLYFYEAKLIAGFNPEIDTEYVILKKCDNFDMDDEMEDQNHYNGWEKEENEDGTFYLVFITQENIKYYLYFRHMYTGDFYGSSETSFIYSLLELELEFNIMTHKFVFENEKLNIVFDNEEIHTSYYGLNYELHCKEDSIGIYLSTREINTDDMSNKVCLTENSNMEKQYVLK